MAYPAGDPLTARWGANIKALREMRGLSAYRLASIIGVHPSNLSRIENGKQRPSDELRIRIAAALNMPAAEIFRYDEELAK